MDQTEEDILRLRQQLQNHEKILAEVQKSFNVKSLEQKVFQSLSRYDAGIKHSFVMTDFSKEKLKDKPGDWKSPAMYTHTGGYKFCIGVDANGSHLGRGKSIKVEMLTMPGEYGNWLKWPAKVDLTIELINQCGGPNVKSTYLCTWNKPTNYIVISSLNSDTFYFILPSGRFRFACFMKHSDIHNYLTEDSLHFNISLIKILC